MKLKFIFGIVILVFLLGCYNKVPPRFCKTEVYLDKSDKHLELRVERNLSQRVFHTWTTYLDSTSLNWFKHGPEINYYISGQEESKVYWINDVKHGPFEYWHSNGQLKGRGEWNNNKLEGGVFEWNTQGKLMAETNWNNGKLEGWSIRKNKQGKTIYKVYWLNGKKLKSKPQIQ